MTTTSYRHARTMGSVGCPVWCWCTPGWEVGALARLRKLVIPLFALAHECCWL